MDNNSNTLGIAPLLLFQMLFIGVHSVSFYAFKDVKNNKLLSQILVSGLLLY